MMQLSSSIMKRAAICQLCSTSNKVHNLLNIAACAGFAKRQGASMLFLPECFGFIGINANQTLLNAEYINDNENTLQQSDPVNSSSSESWYDDLNQMVESSFNNNQVCRADLSTFSTNNNDNANDGVSILKGLKVIAKASGLWISGGGMHEAGAPPKELSNNTTVDHKQDNDELDRKRVYNTHIIMNNNGDIISKYRKIHLFDVSIPSEGIQLLESSSTAPGTQLVVCESPLGKLGLSTCYDVRFPEMYSALTWDGGAEILLVPSAFTVPTGAAHWHALLRARAIENQCYVVAAAQCGRHNERRVSYGHSIAIDPWGEILVDAGNDPDENPKVIFFDIDHDKIDKIRQRMPISAHRNVHFSNFF